MLKQTQHRVALKSLAVLLLISVMLGVGLFISSRGESINWNGYIFVLILYVVIFGFGIFAGEIGRDKESDMLLANRSIPLFVAVFTMSATWVGGGYINGSAEYANTFGLAWVQAPWCYALSLVVGGLLFVKPMRRANYTTMLDPLHLRFGGKMAGLLFLPAMTGELFWTAAILTALGYTFATILGVDFTTAILISSSVSIAYTMVGGLWSVAITDVLQLTFVFGGLVLALPLAVASVGGLEVLWEKYTAAMGSLAGLFPPLDFARDPNWGNYFWQWWDSMFLLIFGGLAWQVYFQRVLAAKSDKIARNLSVFAGLVCFLAATPAVIMGMVGKVTDWSAIGVAPPEGSMTLPYVIYYLTNPMVAIVGLGAITAAVMSSVDSSVLSSSSLLTWNIYRPLVRKTKKIEDLSSKSLGVIMRRCIFIIGVAAVIIALRVKSVYALWFLCSDFVYCILFPQLVAALFVKSVNTYGSAAGFAVSLIMRFGGGEPVFGLRPFLPYPMQTTDGLVLFPYKTLTMLTGFAVILLVSRLTLKKMPAKPLK